MSLKIIENSVRISNDHRKYAKYPSKECNVSMWTTLPFQSPDNLRP